MHECPKYLTKKEEDEKCLTKKEEDDLCEIATALVKPGKVIMATDESTEAFGSRLQSLGVMNSKENRRKYWKLLFTCDPSISENISGVIMHPECFYQKTKDEIPFVHVLKEKRIITGINLDKELVPHAEKYDDLANRCARYKEEGAQFAKLRSVQKISANLRYDQKMQLNGEELAYNAKICQKNGLVPIVETEVLQDGDHDLETTEKVTEKVLRVTYKALAEHNVYLEGTLLELNMVTAGQDCSKKNSPEENALATVRAMSRGVPVAVPGICFLSGKLSDEDATLNMNAINTCPGRKPWALTFMFGRSLQDSVLKTWKGEDKNVKDAQKELMKKVKDLSLLGAEGSGVHSSAEGSGVHSSAEGSGVHSSAEGSGVHSKVIQLFTGQKSDMIKSVMKDLHEMLEKLKTRTKKEVKICNDTKVNTDNIILVLCLHSSRLDVDINKALSDLKPGSKTALLIFHMTTPSWKIMASDRILKNEAGTIIDFVYDRGIQECDINTEAKSKLIKFIQDT